MLEPVIPGQPPCRVRQLPPFSSPVGVPGLVSHQTLSPLPPAPAPTGAGDPLCPRCAEALLLPAGGLEGANPLPWWAVGHYLGAYRRVLLHLRQRPHPESLVALLKRVVPPSFPADVSPLLVPVPSWKRRGNPLPGLVCCLGGRHWQWGTASILQRSRPVLGQHHLNRAMRLANQKGAFTCSRAARPGEARHHPVLLVDDILTSGATALNAATALRQAGWRVHGLICLARTPRHRKPAGGELGSPGR